MDVYIYTVFEALKNSEIADEIAKTAIRLFTEPVQEVRKSLKTIYNEIF